MNKQKAFTTVELLIATAVFSLVLIVAIFGFLQIGQIFYKGITVTRTQDAAEDIINGLAADVRFAAPATQTAPQPTGGSVPNRYYFCAGAHRYTFILGNMVQLASHNETNNFGIIKDDLAVVGSCANPFGGGPPSFNNPTELLGDRMRVSVFTVGQVNNAPASGLSDLYNLNIRIVYGDNTILQNATDTDPANDDCNSSLSNSQYCHAAALNTTVRRGF